jgi:hypothetical protein
VWTYCIDVIVVLRAICVDMEAAWSIFLVGDVV